MTPVLAAPAPPWFVDVTAASGILPLRHGEGVNAVDLDGDNLVDLFLPSVREGARLLKNLGAGHFADITRQAGIAAQGGVGAAIGDLDLDGRPDIYLARGADPYVAANLIYRQQGDGTFRDVSTRSGVGSRSNGLTVTLADFNGDGTLDAFLPGWGSDSLYLQDQGGVFVDGSEAGGLARSGRGWAAVVADFDNDGDLDIFASHGSPAAVGENRLYRNRGDGTFDDVTAASGLASSPWSMGAVSADFDNDGDFDLYVAGFSGPGRLYCNDGDLHFIDVTPASGITARKVVGAATGDIDGDLLPDLVLGGFGGPVELYANRGRMKFEKIGPESGLAAVTRNEGVALADFDDDGDLDLYVSNLEGKNRLYLNNLNDRHYLKLRFPPGGRPLVGSVARLVRGKQILATRELSSAVGMGQGPAEILFRLPDVGPFTLEVTLPDQSQVVKKSVRPGSLSIP